MAEWLHRIFRAAAVCAMATLCPLAHGQAAAGTDDAKTFDAALRAFKDGVYDRAEGQLEEFLRRFPASARVPDAILLQARAAIETRHLQSAINLLSTNSTRAGALADQYRYWLGETYLRGSNYQAAAETFAKIPAEFPNSTRQLEAAFGEALARFQLSQFARVIEVLQRPEGSFRKAAEVQPSNEIAVRGNLLLAEALLAQARFNEAQEFLRKMADKDLTPEFKWRRQYLLCRTLIRSQDLEQAGVAATNLVSLAAKSGRGEFVAESTAVHGRILELIGDFDSAAQVYEKNIAKEVPADKRKQALLKTIELLLAQDKIQEAAQKLEVYLTSNSDELGSDFALLTLGELHLKQHLTMPTNSVALTNALFVGITNHLQTALGFFDRVATNQPATSLSGQGWLNRGWCLWVMGKYPEAAAAFRTALETLPRSPYQAVARFKLGDTALIQNDMTNALAHYRAVATQFSDMPRVRESLLEAAWHQVLRTSLDLRDFQGASEAMEHILSDFPNSTTADRSLLLAGQHLASHDKPAEARKLLRRFVERFPKSSLVPEVELAIARAAALEQDWPGATSQYEAWLSKYEGHALRPKAEFDFGGTLFRAGKETNAFIVFTNFLAEFPTNELAPRAQFWLGDYYWRAEDFKNAEKSYQRVFQSWPRNPLAYQARMMAGRAAFARDVYSDAEVYFGELIKDDTCPPDLLVEAYFALGDTYTREDSDPSKPLVKFSQAMAAFNRIPQLFPSSPITNAAWGRIGDCYLQLAAQDAQLLDSASDAYQKALPSADVQVRSQAEVGLGIVKEKQARARPGPEGEKLMKAARDHFLNVLYGSNLKENEKCSPYWVKEAGFAAARLAEEQQDWEVAVNIYKRLAALLPPVKPILEKKLERAEQLRNGKAL